MPDFNKTYSDLKLLIPNLGSLFEKYTNDIKYKIINNLYKGDDRPSIKFIFACIYLDIEINDGLLLFSSNRYLTDAINIKLVPNENTIENFFINLEKCYKIEKNEFVLFIKKILTEENLINNFKSHFFDKDFLEKNGYLIINNVLDTQFCDELYELTIKLNEFYKVSLKTGYTYGSGQLDRVYSLISKHTIYHKLLLHPLVHEIMSYMFFRETFHDKYYLTSFHANILNPNAEKQIWHIDANVPDPIPPWIIRSNSNFILHDYNENNGATEIIPGSHLWLKKPQKHEVRRDFKESIKLTAPKGSLIIWHGHLWHRSGANKTNQPRVAILGAYSASFLREVCMEENPYLNLTINQAELLDDKLKNLLGWSHGRKNYYFN